MLRFENTCQPASRPLSLATKWSTHSNHIWKRGPFPTSFSFIFVFSTNRIINKNCHWLDSNYRSLGLEATAPTAVPQQLPLLFNVLYLSRPLFFHRCYEYFAGVEPESFVIRANHANHNATFTMFTFPRLAAATIIYAWTVAIIVKRFSLLPTYGELSDLMHASRNISYH